ncbi:PQQ-dependent sugar dehydrogenase [Microcella sp.]|uniref:PQQ-dependent sugar dehydrogenase n=1 Tax=Microcella sp. TaxID=1913979 RepID=UPI00262F9966|nr:PQQ-dependent sugar dehydrogenase [Microcella sp.]
MAERRRSPSAQGARSPVALGVALLLALAGCSSSGTDRSPTGASTPPSTQPPPVEPAIEQWVPDGTVETLIIGLRTPWSVVPLASGSVLISERDTGQVLELTAGGSVRVVGTVADVVAGGEGGLLGLAVLDDPTPALYAFHTAAADNRIVRFDLEGAPGSYGLGASEVLLSGIPKAQNHNGGRLAFGPDGMLYATTGDAQSPGLSQDLDSLAGKILRLTADGAVPADNPFAGSYVYSLGHRNPQGIVFDADGRLWSSELGQNTWDELNLIEAGANYGWPVVEGIEGRPEFVDPVQQWATSEASPSGLGLVGGTLFMASLRGQRLWVIDVERATTSEAHVEQQLGRIRDAVATPDGRLFVLTSNTDANGRPGPDDDRLLVLGLTQRD